MINNRRFKIKRRNFISGLLAAIGFGIVKPIKANESILQSYKLEPGKFEYLKKGPVIRLWKLGSLEHKMYPTQNSVNKLTELLGSIKVGETADLIWGPDIECLEINNSDGFVNMIADPSVEIIKQEDGTVRISVKA